MALTKKINEFKKCFDIEDINIDENITFVIDDKNNLYALFNKKRFILTNQRNTKKFLSHETMKFKKSYGVEFLRAVGIDKTTTAKQIKTKKDLQEKMISLFRCVNCVYSDFDLSAITYVKDNKLYTDLDDKKVILFSCGRPEFIVNNGDRAIKNKLAIPSDLHVIEIHKYFTEDFGCNIPNNIPDKEIKNKMQLMYYQEPTEFNGCYTKKYVSFFESDNISDVLDNNHEDIKSVIEKNASVFQIEQLKLFLKCEFYSRINNSEEKELPLIINFSSAVDYDNYDDFISNSKISLTKSIERFVMHNKLEFCDIKLSSLCLCIEYRPQIIPLF